VHYDDYGVFRSPLSDFLAAVNRDETDWRVTTPARGETVPLAAAEEVPRQQP
jgi:hypothetical protein